MNAEFFYTSGYDLLHKNNLAIAPQKKDNLLYCMIENPEAMTIYFVEDDSIYAEFIKKTLARNPVYQITWFATAEACLVEAERKLPDALILDYKLPGMNGLELYQKISPRLSEESKCIIMSSIEDGNLVLSFIQQGVRDYVIKDESVIDSLISILEGKEEDYYLFN